jgi:hypothetical protein
VTRRQCQAEHPLTGAPCTQPVGHGPLADEWDDRLWAHGDPESGWFWQELPSETRRELGPMPHDCG